LQHRKKTGELLTSTPVVCAVPLGGIYLMQAVCCRMHDDCCAAGAESVRLLPSNPAFVKTGFAAASLDVQIPHWE